MNRLRSSRLNRLLLDDRGVLGVIVLCLAWFVGSTFGTKAATLVWFAVAVLLTVIFRASQRAASAKSKSSTDGVSTWREAAKTLLLMACLVGCSLVIFSWRFLDRASDVSNVLALSVDTIGHSCVAMACVLWAVQAARGHVLLLIVGMVAMLMGLSLIHI